VPEAMKPKKIAVNGGATLAAVPDTREEKDADAA
jgi:molecular chaperone IbpA